MEHSGNRTLSRRQALLLGGQSKKLDGTLSAPGHGPAETGEIQPGRNNKDYLATNPTAVAISPKSG